MGAFEDYASAVAAFKAANAKLDEIAMNLRGVADALTRQRSYFHFSNAQGEFPPEVIMNPRSPSANGNEWPTAVAINGALTRWHQSRNTLRQVWNSLPKEQKDALQPPPKEAMIA